MNPLRVQNSRHGKEQMLVLSTHGAVEGKERDREFCAAEDGLCQEEVQEVP